MIIKLDSITLRGPIACMITTDSEQRRNENIIVVDHLGILRRPNHLVIYMVTDDILSVWEYNQYSLVRYTPRPLESGELRKIMVWTQFDIAT